MILPLNNKTNSSLISYYWDATKPSYFTLIIVSNSLMDCKINYALRLVLQNVNDLLLIKFLLQMIIIISSSGFNKHTFSQAFNLLISLLRKQFAKNHLAMSSVFLLYLGQTNCFAKLSLAQNFLSDDVVSSMKLPNSIQKLEIAQKSSNDCMVFMTIFS